MPRKSSRRSSKKSKRKPVPASDLPAEGEATDAAEAVEAAGSPEDEEVMKAAREAAGAAAAHGAPGEAPGEITIDPGIVSQIATRETLAVEGVAGLAGGSFLGIGGHGKAVAVEVEGASASITLRVTVAYGRNVRDVAERVRCAVYDGVTRMTGFSVTRVDVRVCGLKATEAEGGEPDALPRVEEGPGGASVGAPIEF